MSVWCIILGHRWMQRSRTLSVWLVHYGFGYRQCERCGKVVG